MTNYEKNTNATRMAEIQQLKEELEKLIDQRQRVQKFDALSLEFVTQLQNQLEREITRIENAQHSRNDHLERGNYKNSCQKNSVCGIPAVSMASALTIMPTIVGIGGILDTVLQTPTLPLFIAIPLACSFPICVCGVQLFCDKNIIENQISTSWENPKLTKLKQNLSDISKVLYYKKQGKKITNVLDEEIKNLRTQYDKKLDSCKGLVTEYCRP
ncbi:MAG: hypothetical protein IJA22_00475 [Clostridia bacterium]|nr:hypothetical protein [Clostridia bacterium]